MASSIISETGAYAPSSQPSPGVFLTAEWRWLAMVNYVVDPAVLRPFVPAGTEADSHEGKTFVSMVGFRFLGTRICGVPVPFHRNFDEVNLRFYVRRATPGGGWKRGAVFIKEMVPRPAIAWTARLLYNEPYIYVPMRHRVEPEGISAEYGWKRRGKWESLRVEARGEPSLPGAGSEEEFITEHYWGYNRQRNGSTMEYQVEHPQWRVWRASDYRFDCDAAALYGEAFRPFLSGPASSAFLAEGSAVAVRHGRRLAL